MSELQYALDRMSTPLDPSRLSGATADEDARCMGIIRAEIERLQRIVDEDLGRASEREAKLRAEVLARTRERDEARAERDALRLAIDRHRRNVWGDLSVRYSDTVRHPEDSSLYAALAQIEQERSEQKEG